MFNFFKKKKDEKPREVRYVESLESENQVTEDEWILDFEKRIKKTNDSSTKIALIQSAQEQGINRVEVQREVIKLFNENPANKDFAMLAFNQYYDFRMYKEALEIYNEFVNAGGELTYIMHYDISKVYRELGEKIEEDNNLMKCIKLNGNFSQAIDRFILNSKDGGFFDELASMMEVFESFYFGKELAKILYEMGNTELATEVALKSLEYSKTDKNTVQIGMLLKENNKMAEFEDYIIPRYYINTKEKDFHIIILDFYYKNKEESKGLSLLNSLYELGVYNEEFSKYEKAFLIGRLRASSPRLFKNLIDNKPSDNVKSDVLPKPTYIFKGEKDVKERPIKVLILPFFIRIENIRIMERIKNYAKNISIYLVDNLFVNTNLSVFTVINHDELGIIVRDIPYSKEYFEIIKNKNEKIDYILYGEIKDIKHNGSFEFKIYLYDAKNNTNMDIYRADTSVEILNETTSTFINSCLTKYLDINLLEDVKIKDSNFMQYYSDYMEILLNVKGYNKDRKFTAESILRYCLKNVNELNMNIALLLVYKLRSQINNIDKKYKAELYNAIFSNPLSKDIQDKYRIIYGDNNG